MAILDKLTPALRNLLDHHPEPGQRNVWLFRVAACCRGRCTEASFRRFLYALRDRWDVGRPLTDAEIERAISRGFNGAKVPPSPAQRLHRLGTPEWLEPNPAKRQFYADATKPLFNAAAPISIPSGAVIDTLFPGGGLLCLGWDKNNGATWEREHWRGYEGDCQFIVPSRMIAPGGLNSSGQESYRCLENTGPREYLVIESDTGGDKVEQSRVLSYLATLAPLVLVVDSGSKSLHGWIDCQGVPQHKVARFMQYAVWLGADRHLWVPCQWVRMPGGTRSGGARQHILFFRPLGGKQ